MQRLTERKLYDGRVCFTKCKNKECPDKCINCDIPKEAASKLKEYEDMEEQGNLFKFPCKVGDRIYSINTNVSIENRKIEIYDIDKILILADGRILLKDDAYGGVICELENILSDKPYLTCYRCFIEESAAESALQEMKEKEGQK